ncbi:hypothetical protein PB2503_06832 [Parvularcula bermudensis HTCC2503]|uniref:Uncharacterized protein n=1 Tax=Parvularcula bermudensis (strain ATCC BAA-594 / HTCC2503 / KCTC 12087) TaxID=314260 RepID=E0TI93_PARBH|nr:hypothetical protein PB2503_06832 [Parvularcula bermudensis HTCC2503]
MGQGRLLRKRKKDTSVTQFCEFVMLSFVPVMRPASPSLMAGAFIAPQPVSREAGEQELCRIWRDTGRNS